MYYTFLLWILLLQYLIMNKLIYTIVVLCNSHNPEYPHETKYTNLSKTECSRIINFYDTLATNKVYTYKVDSTYLNNKN